MKKTRIIFFGSSVHSLPTLKALLKQKGCQIITIVSQPDRPVGRKQMLTPTPVSALAREKKISLFTPQSQKEKSWLYQNPKKLARELGQLKANLLISAYYGQKIPEEILKIAPFGGLNLHPSLLPKYRGTSPIQWAILNGEKETGITILKMAEKFDQGEIVAQEKVKIKSTDTAETLYTKLFVRGAKLLIKILPDYLSGKIKLKKQDESQATYYPRLTREDGKIDWSKTPQEIDRQIRAFTPWPSSWTEVELRIKNYELRIKRLKILKAHLDKGKLILDQVQLEGKKPVSFEEFKKGYPNFKLS